MGITALPPEKTLTQYLPSSQKIAMFCAAGEVPEWLNGPVLKTGVRASVPWVRIPPSPPIFYYYQ